MGPVDRLNSIILLFKWLHFSLPPQPAFLFTSSPSTLSLIPPILPSSQSLLVLCFNLLLLIPPSLGPAAGVAPPAPALLLLRPGRTHLPGIVQGSFKAFLHLCPKLKIEYRYSLLFFSGCLCSFGRLHGMGGIDQTKDQDEEDNMQSISLVYIKL